MIQRRLTGAGGMIAAILMMVGCDQGENAVSPNGTASVAPSAAPTAAAYAAAPGDAVELTPPAGWTSATRGGWTVWTSADKRAALAASALAGPNDTAAKRTELEGVFGVSDIRLTSPQPLTIGVDRMSAQAADGACRFASGDGAIAFAVLDASGGKQGVVAYAFEKDAPAESREQAMAAVASLRKKR